MPPRKAVEPYETPQKVRYSFDKIIRSVNARWDLNLPDLHGSQERALQHAEGTNDLAGRCSGRIRYLCHRNCDLDKVVGDFADEIPRLCSEWVWKPSQDAGTLPKLPVTKSFISRTPALPQKNREVLQQRLLELLMEEVHLARQSEAYSRTSYTENRGEAAVKSAPVVGASSVLASGVKPKAGPRSKQSLQGSREGTKRKSSESHKSTKPSKKQMTLSQMDVFRTSHETGVAPIASKHVSDTSASRPAKAIAQSFDSAINSNGAPEIFTPPRAVTIDSEHTSFRKDTEGPSPRGRSPVYFSTQDAKAFVDDEEFTKSFTKLSEPSKSTDLSGSAKSAELFHKLCDRTPFRPSDLGVFHDISFEHRHEIERVAAELHLTPRLLLQSLRKSGISSQDDYDRFWEASRVIGKNRDRCLPAKPTPEACKRVFGTGSSSEKPHHSIHQSGALTFKPTPDGGIFDFKLKPLQLDRSCRFHRKFGPSRFMVVWLPSLTDKLPTRVKDYVKNLGGAKGLKEATEKWLTTEHNFLGRRWKAFYLEPDKKKRSKSSTPALRDSHAVCEYKLHLFAVSGDGIPSREVTEVHEFLNWHIPIRKNSTSTDLKLFQRVRLGLSKTIPTVCIHPSEFVRLPDPVGHAVMNDGCASLSTTLAKAIAQRLGLKETPSAYQGRIAGCKGLWMVMPDAFFTKLGKNGYCIEIADSQLKIKPHPEDDFLADEHKRTFEVSNYSGPTKSAHLSIQLLRIIHERGVPRETLGGLLIADMSATYEQLGSSMCDPASIRSWLDSSSIYTRDEESTKLIGSWPDHSAERAIRLVESGFTPKDNSELHKAVDDLLRKYLERYVEKLKIGVPCSTYLYCVADPCGVLEADEVHVSFSVVWNDPLSGFKESFVEDQDVLVGRLPALLPSDIQRRKAVWKRELHHLKDVVVFPTKGDTPLAGLLSGGDYDGDSVWLCWDQSLVRPFENVAVPDMPATEEYLTPCNRRIKDVFAEDPDSDQLRLQMHDFLVGCLSFNLNDPRLGLCSSEHDKLVYEEQTLSCPGAVLLAAICGILVDSPKQGNMMTQEIYQKLLGKVSPESRSFPAYHNKGDPSRAKDSNIIDHLKLKVAEDEKGKMLKEFHKRWPKPRGRDSTLCEPWRSVTAKFRKGAEAKVIPQEVLNKLDEELEDIIARHSLWKSGEYGVLMSQLREDFQAIRPLENVPALASMWKSEQGRDYGRWALLRASCLYAKHAEGPLAWHLGGNELCKMKAESHLDGYRPIISSLHPMLRVHKKRVERDRQRRIGMSFEVKTKDEGIDQTYSMSDED